MLEQVQFYVSNKSNKTKNLIDFRDHGNVR